MMSAQRFHRWQRNLHCSFPQVSSVLVGIDRMDYLDSALETADGHYLDVAKLAQVRELAYPNPEFLDSPKWDRMGWLK